MTKEEELALIGRVRSGHNEAFEPLLLENQSKVYQLAFRMVGNEADACDIAQEAFLRAYSSLKDFRGDSRFSVWLYRLTSNLCIDFLRREKRGRVISLNVEDEEGEELELQIPDERFAPEGEYEKKELREALGRALKGIPEDSRQILVLREVSGLSYDEIADALSLEPGTVKSRLNRARKKLCAEWQRVGNLSACEPSKRRKGV